MARIALSAIVIAGLCVSSARAASTGVDVGYVAVTEPISYAAEKPDSDITMIVPVHLYNLMTVEYADVVFELGKLSETGSLNPFIRNYWRIHMEKYPDSIVPKGTELTIKLNIPEKLKSAGVTTADFTHYRATLRVARKIQSTYIFDEWLACEVTDLPTFYEYTNHQFMFAKSGTFTPNEGQGVTFSKYPDTRSTARLISTGIQPIPR